VAGLLDPGSSGSGSDHVDDDDLDLLDELEEQLDDVEHTLARLDEGT
jgi:hypothetical protein